MATEAHILTPQQQSVLAVLAKEGKPLSAYAVLDQLEAVKSPPIVYRALDKLASLGLIHRLASLNAYIACCQHSHSNCGHDHGHAHDHRHDHVSQFAICTRCGDVRELESAQLPQLAAEASAGFLADIHKNIFEISGICRACAQAA